MLGYLKMYSLLFMVGSSIGSFFILLGSRTAKHESIIFPGSHCTNCLSLLRPYELIPVFSWLFLKGKCRYCQLRIPVRIVLLESLSGVVMMVAYYLCNSFKVLILVLMIFFFLLSMRVSYMEEGKIDNRLYIYFFLISSLLNVMFVIYFCC